MRALFTTQPAHGHLHPLVPFARAWVAAGHQAAFATAPLFCPAVEAMGFEALPAGLDYLWERAEDYFPEGRDAAQAGRGLEWAMRHVNYGEALGPMVRDLLELVEQWRPDVMVHDVVEMGAVIAGELRGIPVASGTWGVGPQDDWGFDAGDAWNRRRAEYGLPPDQDGAAAARCLVLTAAPPSWAALRGGRRLTTHHFRVPFTDAREGDVVPDWLTRPGRRPRVYATVGTVYNFVERLFAKIMLALEELPVDVLMTVGRNIDPRALGAAPDNVAIERYVPQSLAFAHVDLVLSHAGYGTVFGALAHGLPMVLMSLGADHPLNAERAVALGAAQIIPPRRLDVATIRTTVENALQTPSLRRRSESVREEISSLPPVEDSVALLERLARERAPILAGG